MHVHIILLLVLQYTAWNLGHEGYASLLTNSHKVTLRGEKKCSMRQMYCIAELKAIPVHQEDFSYTVV